MAPSIDDLHGRIRAAVAGVLAGDREAEGNTGAAQFLAVAESLALHDHLDVEDLRSRGLGAPPIPGPAAAVLRAVPFGLLAAFDRPFIRRGAYRSALTGGVDEGTAITAVAAAVLAADLLRFDLETSLVRVRQTLLEEAPLAVLARLRPLAADAAWPSDTDPGAALQVALTVLASVTGVRAALDEVKRRDPHAGTSLALAGALAGARDGMRDLDEGWIEALPGAGRGATDVAGLHRRAAARLEAAAAPAPASWGNPVLPQ